MNLAAAAAIVASAGCRSPAKKAEESRATAASWAVTARETVLLWKQGQVPSAFALDALRAAADALADEAESLRKLARDSPDAGPAARVASDAAAEARALVGEPAAAEIRGARLAQAAVALRRKEPR